MLHQRIVLLDGAMGTMIQQRRLSEAQFRGDRFVDHPGTLKGNNELLNLTQPEIVRGIHEAYLAAGSDIVETNTFGATAIAQADYGLGHLAREMNVQAAKLARAACDRVSTPNRPRFVAGAIGPTPRTASISPDVNDPGARNVSFDELRAAYREQVEGLAEGGADILLVETIFDTLNAKAAAFAVDEFFEASGERLPVILSGIFTDASGRVLRDDTCAHCRVWRGGGMLGPAPPARALTGSLNEASSRPPVTAAVSSVQRGCSDTRAGSTSVAIAAIRHASIEHRSRATRPAPTADERRGRCSTPLRMSMRSTAWRTPWTTPASAMSTPPAPPPALRAGTKDCTHPHHEHHDDVHGPGCGHVAVRHGAHCDDHRILEVVS